MKKILVNLLKLVFAAGLIGYLTYDASQKPEFAQALREPKDWGMMTAAFALMFSALCLSFVRWYGLVRALDFQFTLKHAFRLGFLGYLFNFVAPGGVGGDLFKAVFIAREFPGRRAQAVATVIIDRIIGLYALFVVASAAILLNGLWASSTSAVRIVAKGTLAGTLVGAIGIVMLLIPGFTNGRFSKLLGELPRVGRIFEQLLEAVRMYRARLGSVVLALGISMIVHMLTVVGFFTLGISFPGANPTLSENFVILPLAMVAGAVPITPAGLGTMEATIEYLFPAMSATHVAGSRGLLIALVYRLMSLVMALIGVVIYMLFRREVSAVIHEAEEESAAAVA